MAREDWVAERVREFAALRGRTVHAWSGVEMAFFEDPPRFEDPRAPFLQLLLLSGEACEDWGDNLIFHRRDTSVLVFTDPALVDTVPWYRN